MATDSGSCSLGPGAQQGGDAIAAVQRTRRRGMHLGIRLVRLGRSIRAVLARLLFRRPRVDVAARAPAAASGGDACVGHASVEAAARISLHSALTSVPAPRIEDPHEAFRRAESALDARADAARLRLALADLHERAGNHARMFELLDAMPPPANGAGRLNLLAARYAWFCDDLDRALRYVQPIIDTFYEWRNGDDAFLFVRGMPSVAETVGFAAAMHVLRGDIASARRLVAQAQERIENVDLVATERFLACKQHGDFQPLLEELPVDARGGVAAAQAAILGARLTSDFDAATALLRQVVLPEQQFERLEDVLLLAGCELAARGGDGNRESQLRGEFLARRPMLIEPDRVLVFDLLEYQEKLKPHARARRANAGAAR